MVILALLGGLVISLLTGGSLRRLADVRLRQWWLLAVAVIAQQSSVVTASHARIGFGVAAVAAAGFVACNRGVRGLGLLALGLVSNFVAIVANNGFMPVSLTALGQLNEGFFAASDSLHSFGTSHTRLRLLTDVIAVHIPFGQGSVLSVGDVVVSAGVGLTVFAACRSTLAGVPRWTDGEKGSEAARTQEQQGQPRQAS